MTVVEEEEEEEKKEDDFVKGYTSTPSIYVFSSKLIKQFFSFFSFLFLFPLPFDLYIYKHSEL